MRRNRCYIAHLLLLLIFVPLMPAETPDEPYKFFRNFAGLNEEQIAAVRAGKAIAKHVESSTPDEVFIFGAVYVRATPDSYLKLAADIDALRKLPSYLAVQSFSVPPQASDLEAIVLDRQDIEDLRNCRAGHCEVQLPSEAMEDFQRSVDWSAPDVGDRVNRVARLMAVQALLDYMQGGDTALGTYRDKTHPAAVAQSFASLLARCTALPVYFPELNQYLLEYPKVTSNNVHTAFYWEKVNFGLKPTFRIVQRSVYRKTDAGDPVYAVAEKQLYATHYFQAAFDLTVCVKDPQRPGFYLITLKGSKQAGLTGLKGSILRKVAVDKTRSSLEQVLLTIKQKLESAQ